MFSKSAPKVMNFQVAKAFIMFWVPTAEDGVATSAVYILQSVCTFAQNATRSGNLATSSPLHVNTQMI